MFNINIKRDLRVALTVIFVGLVLSMAIALSGYKVAKAEGEENGPMTHSEAYSLCGNWGGVFVMSNVRQTWDSSVEQCLITEDVACKTHGGRTMWVANDISYYNQTEESSCGPKMF